MVLMLTNGSGITLAGTKFQKARLIPIQSKQIMLNYVIILLAWLENRVVFLDVLMHLNVRCVYSSTVSTAGNFTNNIFRIMPLMLWTLLAHYFSHSPFLGEKFICDFLWYNFAALILRLN